jgi:PAB-dependent poly(A)-specific ribonuclease subunit 3
MVYDYHPNAETLFDFHLNPRSLAFNGRTQHNKSLIPERTLWSYIIQIAGAIKVVHDAGMAVRVIDTTKILVAGKNRFACCLLSSITVWSHYSRSTESGSALVVS